MDDAVLEKIYQEKLEERIIATLAEKHGISLEEAMNVYYNSKLADKIHRGVEGVWQNNLKLFMRQSLRAFLNTIVLLLELPALERAGQLTKTWEH